MNTKTHFKPRVDVACRRAVGWSSCLLLLLPCLLAGAESPVNDARSTLEKWVETRQLISKTRADWQADKDTLEQTVALYERELSSLQEQMSKVTTNNTQAEKEMQEALALQKTSQAALDQARQFASEFETKLKKLVPQLPVPLQDIVKPLVVRLPEDPEKTKMLSAERVQVCVGVLNELDKFNNAVNVFNEKRKNDKGEEVAVQTMYIGLGAAYFVNETADFAGVGAPGANGWHWTNKPEIAPTVEAAVKMYRNEQTARFVTLPVMVK
jgi:septal ring factor EnvC (AmiA/AmiB activator)